MVESQVLKYYKIAEASVPCLLFGVGARNCKGISSLAFCWMEHEHGILGIFPLCVFMVTFVGNSLWFESGSSFKDCLGVDDYVVVLTIFILRYFSMFPLEATYLRCFLYYICIGCFMMLLLFNLHFISLWFQAIGKDDINSLKARKLIVLQ